MAQWVRIEGTLYNLDQFTMFNIVEVSGHWEIKAHPLTGDVVYFGHMYELKEAQELLDAILVMIGGGMKPVCLATGSVAPGDCASK